jgi:hypothetical protein
MYGSLSKGLSMYNYIPFYSIMAVMVGLIALLIKLYITYVRYTLVEIGKQKSPENLTWKVIKENSGFFLGTDLKARVKAVGAFRKIFAHNQDKSLEGLARSFRNDLVLLLMSLAVALTGIFLANGQPTPIIVTAMAALAVAIWGLLK